jgi:dimethylaniline monooxygenase (N-oxide forming)
VQPGASTCIVGGGCSGLTTAKALTERGLEFDWFEASDHLGGLWAAEGNGSAAYRNLHINTSRERMEFSDFPMPSSYPDFPARSHIGEYFDAYADRFGLRERVTLNTRVERVEPGDERRWSVTLAGGERRAYDAVIVANGHHWDPRWPEPAYPGEFAGEQMHAHAYLDNGQLRDRRVLVVGMGNSAMDIATDASFVAARTFVSARRGAWVLPKYLFGKPFDQVGVSPLTGYLPWRVRQRTIEAIYRVAVGKPQDYGLPKPDHRIGDAHPTVSADFLNRVGHGEIEMRPGIERLDGERVRFLDGSAEAVDLIVYCTGYKVTFPFFDPALVSAPDNDLPLYRRLFHPELDGLYFIGLLQPLGAIMPIAEAQGQWVAEHLLGEYALPPRAEMLRDIERERARMFKRYVRSKRHTMQVDFEEYMLQQRKERERGRARAAARPQPGSPSTSERGSHTGCM